MVCSGWQRRIGLHVRLDERRKHPVLLLQQSLGFVVLQNVPSLHHDDQIGGEDGVDTVLKQKAAAAQRGVRQADGRPLKTVCYVMCQDVVPRGSLPPRTVSVRWKRLLYERREREALIPTGLSAAVRLQQSQTQPGKENRWKKARKRQERRCGAGAVRAGPGLLVSPH